MTTRRDFLKLFGFGAAAAATGGVGTLFTSRESGLLLGGGDHLVFDTTTPLLQAGARAGYLSKMPLYTQDSWRAQQGCAYDVLWMSQHREQGWTPVGEPVDYETQAIVTPVGEDPHVTFLLAAVQLRDTINLDIQEYSKELSRQGLVMVTVVDSPIMSYPLPDAGYALGTQLRQFAVRKENLLNTNQAISDCGEIPIETPSSIEFKVLAATAEACVQMGLVDNWRKNRQAVAKVVSSQRKLLSSRLGST